MLTKNGRSLRRIASACLRAARQRLLAFLRPAMGTPVAGALGDLTRTKAGLVADNAPLRQRLVVLRRQVRRPALIPAERLRLALLARLARGWRAALLIVQPGTLLRWHRQGCRLLWRVRSTAATKRPQVAAETVAPIERMAAEDRLWGAERRREATPCGECPRFLIRDDDGRFGPTFARVAVGSRITVLRTPLRAPRANATCERFLGRVLSS